MCGGSYTERMDSGRIGKALGIGTRVFSKAVVHAMEQTAEKSANTARAQAAAAKAAPVVRDAAKQTAASTTATAKRAMRFGEAIWGPFVHLSGVVWLEAMGVLFAFVALFFSQSLWKHRTDIFLPPTDVLFQHYLVYIGSTGLFVYFAVSSFVRAERKSRRRR